MARPASDRAAQPRILGGTIEITGYPFTMSLAEKIVTMMQRGTANTRWRDDFFDACTLTHQHQHPLNDDELRESMSTVANHRQAGLVPR
jgi:nucleotidyltransferase AbiEii toxin of type IV toxin-antitoxin system